MLEAADRVPRDAAGLACFPEVRDEGGHCEVGLPAVPGHPAASHLQEFEEIVERTAVAHQRQRTDHQPLQWAERPSLIFPLAAGRSR